MTDQEKAQMMREEIAALSKILEEEGLMSVGYRGQPVAHPALAQRRATMALLYKVETRIRMLEEADTELEDFLGE